jgi:hypothetical protein
MDLHLKLAIAHGFLLADAPRCRYDRVFMITLRKMDGHTTDTKKAVSWIAPIKWERMLLIRVA